MRFGPISPMNRARVGNRQIVRTLDALGVCLSFSRVHIHDEDLRDAHSEQVATRHSNQIVGFLSNGEDAAQILGLGDEHAGRNGSGTNGESRREALNAFIFAVSDADEVEILDESDGVRDIELPIAGGESRILLAELCQQLSRLVKLHDPAVTVTISYENVSVGSDRNIGGFAEMPVTVSGNKCLAEYQ